VSELNEDEIQFARTQIESIVKDLKPKFALGVPSMVFVNYLRKLLEKFIMTEGVENAIWGMNPTSGALLSSFEDMRRTRANLERLQQALEEAQTLAQQTQQRVSQEERIRALELAARPGAPFPERPPPPVSSGMEIVPFRQVSNQIQNALLLLPTAEELQKLENMDLQTRSVVYTTIADIERFFPDDATIENFIRSIRRASQRNDINEINGIIATINSQIQLSPDQQLALRELQNMSGVAEREMRTERRQIEAPPAGGAREEPSVQVSPVKPYKGYRINAENQSKIDSVEYPIARERFIRELKAPERRYYIARALQEGGIPEGVNEKINEKDQETGLFFTSPLTPSGVVNRPKYYTAGITLEIFDKYLASSAPTEGPIEEISGTPQRRYEEDILSVSSPTGVASLRTQAPMKKGKGITGRGVAVKSRNRVEGRIEGEHQPKSEFSFAPLGRYIINTNKLQKGILTVNSKTGKSLPRLKSKAISKQLTEIFKNIVKGKDITNDMTSELTEEDIDTFYNVLNECHLLSKYDTPTSQNLNSVEKDLNRFMLLKGQILAGQNNEAVVKEFKVLLLKYMKKGQIPRSQAQEILEELLMLGY
jgi:hypothetical protein